MHQSQVDHGDIGDGTAAYPSLAMAPNGAAYVAYRVVTDPLSKDEPLTGIQPMRPGDELVDVRVARFNGFTWSDLPAVNRLPVLSANNPPALTPVEVLATVGLALLDWLTRPSAEISGSSAWLQSGLQYSTATNGDGSGREGTNQPRRRQNVAS